MSGEQIGLNLAIQLLPNLSQHPAICNALEASMPNWITHQLLHHTC